MVAGFNIKHVLKDLGAGLAELLFPKLCAGCRLSLTGGEAVVCLHCELQLPFTAYHHQPDNDTVMRLAGRFPFLHATSLLYFHHHSLVQDLIHGLKYSGKLRYGYYLGAQLGRTIVGAGWQPDAVIPVPLHKRKERQRGFNQSAIIAGAMAKELGLPVLGDALIRNRNTPSQTDKTRGERVANVRHAFTLRQPAAVRGRHILLVDDVLTTGATIESCALALMDAGGVRLSIATAAITAD